MRDRLVLARPLFHVCTERTHSHRAWSCRAFRSFEPSTFEVELGRFEGSHRFVGLPFGTHDVNPASVCLDTRLGNLTRIGCLHKLIVLMGLEVSFTTAASVNPAVLICARA